MPTVFKKIIRIEYLAINQFHESSEYYFERKDLAICDKDGYTVPLALCTRCGQIISREYTKEHRQSHKLIDAMTEKLKEE